MKALSLRAPWWWTVLYGGQDIHNCSWQTDHRGPVLIHASRWWSAHQVSQAIHLRVPGIAYQNNCPPPLVMLQARCGQIVGVVELVDVVTASKSPWFNGPIGLVLRDPRPVDPYPARGALELFDAPAPAGFSLIQRGHSPTTSEARSE